MHERERERERERACAQKPPRRSFHVEDFNVTAATYICTYKRKLTARWVQERSGVPFFGGESLLQPVVRVCTQILHNYKFYFKYNFTYIFYVYIYVL